MAGRLEFRQWLEGPDSLGSGFGFGQSDIDSGLNRPQSKQHKIPPSDKADQVFLGKQPKKVEVVSFDFDGVLHTSLIPGTTHPENFWSADLSPREDVHDLVVEEAKSYKVVCVTARDYEMSEIIEEFLDRHNLPIKEIYTTNNGPKLPVLMSLNAIRHYDDKDMTRELAGTGIEFIHLPLF